MERNLDFDTILNRRGTDSLKYDCAVRRGKPENILPMWVADMDFKTSSAVTDAIIARTEQGVFGYTEPGKSYFQAVQNWLKIRHGWKVQAEWLVKTPGVVFALAAAVRAYTDVGESVLIQQPVYYPFSEVIQDNGRKVISSDLVQGSDGRYYIDFADFEQKIINNNIKLFLLCNPHNPVGRVWTAGELSKIGEICLKHGVKVVSDEIHQDFALFKNKHNVFANLRDEFRKISVTCTSPAKTFNLAGLQVSNIFIPDGAMRAAFKRQIAAAGYSQLNTLGLTACEAAYRYGGEWYAAMIKYIEANACFVKEYAAQSLFPVKLTPPEGTYLLWLDFRALGLSNGGLNDLIINKAGLWLDDGAVFGRCGEGFQRINIACPRQTLQTALKNLKKALQNS